MRTEIEVTRLDLLKLYWEYYKRSKLYSKGETFEEFYQIHRYQMEELQDNLRKYDFLLSEKNKKPEAIQFLESGALKQMMKDYRKSLVGRLKREPRASEFIEEFNSWLSELISKLKADQVELKKLEKQTPLIKGSFTKKGTIQFDVKRSTYSAMKRFIMAYDLKEQGYKIMDIARLTCPAEKLKKWDKNNIKRVVDRDIEKAKKIIKNVEQFEFPGKH